jgi:regulator of replication initiation timing
MQSWKEVATNLAAIKARNTDMQRTHLICLLTMESHLDHLLQQLDATKCINNELVEAYHALHEQNTHLKAMIKDIMSKITEQTMTPTPRSLDITRNHHSAMQEISLQLFDIQCNVQDVLDMVCNPMGKRKCAARNNYDNMELISPMSRITNDMLLGAMVTSTGLWVIGITVAVGYLVITA